MAHLQRKDLAKEFSQIVQQEIKNHNDSILVSNMAIDDFRRQLLDLKTQYEKLKNTFQADISIQSTDLTNLEDSINEAMKAVIRDLNDSTALNKRQVESLCRTIGNRESYFLTLQGFEEFREKIAQWVANIDRLFFQQKDAYSQEISKITEKMQISIENSRNMLEKCIKEEKEAREKQEKTFDIFAVNFSCLKEEVEILKRSCFVLEKHNENLYTQIERLKVNK